MRQRQFLSGVKFYQLKKRWRPEDITICAHFGCGKELTITEKLFGNYCENHSKKPKQIDVTDFIQY